MALMEIKSSIAFDDELKKIDFFKGHEYMLPFVGEKYREGGILHIGASYYFKLDDIEEAQRKIAEQILDEWFDTSDKAVKMRGDFLNTYRNRKSITGKDTHKSKFVDWVNTRKIVESFCNGNAYNEKSRAIYREFLKAAYDKRSSEDLKDTEGYAPFSYMNFFQKPTKDVQTKHDDDAVCNSCEIVKAVIEILQPKIIIFTSSIAYDAFFNNANNLKFQPKGIIRLPHPTSNWWNRTQKWRDGSEIAMEKSTAMARLARIFEILSETQ